MRGTKGHKRGCQRREKRERNNLSGAEIDRKSPPPLQLWLCDEKRNSFSSRRRKKSKMGRGRKTGGAYMREEEEGGGERGGGIPSTPLQTHTNR